MPPRSREINVFSMSFLDVISAGFGAVVLLFMIINARVDLRSESQLKDLTSEAKRMELKVETGRKNLAQVREDLERMVQEWASLRGMRDQLVNEIRDTQNQAVTAAADDEARKAAIEKLRAELKQLETQTQELSAASIQPSDAGDRIRAFQGEGNRQYLTGLRMGGKHVVILVNASASMLDRTLVNVIRRRNMSPAQQKEAPKWKQVVGTVDWLTTQIQPGTQIQVIAFSDKATSLIPNTDGKWVTVTNGSELQAAVDALKGMYPKGPESLHAAFNAARALDPKPDNIYLLVDKLPTMGEIVPPRQGVTGKERLDHFNRAVRQLPVGVPVNVILFAMEGDPNAAPAYWTLALRTGGSLLAPSEDWP
jgi:hypothetical protein